MRKIDPDPQTTRRREATAASQARRRKLERLAREVAEELLLDVPVDRIRAVADGLNIQGLTETDINQVLSAIPHAEVRTAIPEVNG